ncbi:L-seryl-tRNA(Sec) selenium transferase [Mycobacterium sp. CBMA293]|uniref:L-seryl-tRNA(Sec) selenium transferase n=1 Tax=unclassified Mycolicibacterium TaxID=2636767 RepID=UPI001324DC33|nr:MULTISPECIES: L-seryl-tRNA(Sec) selenium transferase [unclassified Mycolicibacterium]MUL46224.1 L-seryl-tRNA(Sec) selenium transferase [Mycolicibacterium sp. CBMA 360]MUL94083.1 L-seryl-tRNA(Sec) selenium transferase [Mycolicibacterium sp. CBMA 230]MUL58725.1 L-seryl-tRNA(Sec) selenium transferase [Mycolicibacterium sp. CBMA 335]MUL69119.1 L-seryl-tRNA(Sec) selenium transferase [Mycolicibacterium sp. CBMA 311]MUM05094.1 L-seryl-tRNA(Sec) selenium transferase [Mycolicibacterium sp. CBMA 213]
MSELDPRRLIPRTDQLLALPEVCDARNRLGDSAVRTVVTQTQERARQGDLPPGEVATVVVAALAQRAPVSLRPVLNATGVVVHTNLGRAPLSAAAVDALVAASGYVDVEMDLSTGVRSKRGVAARAALLAACPSAEDALVVNNGAAALVLATTALAAGREVVVSRGELIEIGAGFRLPDLIASTGARLREVGTTNRTHLRDYADALSPDTGCVLKVHPSNFRVTGFTSGVSFGELQNLLQDREVPLVVDLGSGLLAPDPLLPDEPDAATALAAGADVITGSGDKLLGGPQAGIVLGRADVVARMARHPLARAVRADKLTLAALEATLCGGPVPVMQALHADGDRLRARAERIAEAVGATVVPHDGRVGGGGAPGVPLPGWAVRLPEATATALRTGNPAVVARVHDGACLIDLRCVPETYDDRILTAVQTALGG